MSQTAGASGVWWLTCLGVACAAGAPAAREPAVDDGPASAQPPALDEQPTGGAAGLRGGASAESVDRSVFVVDDALEGELARPTGHPAPPSPDAGLSEVLQLAERLFEEADVAQAARLYEQVAAAPDNALAAYARYKLAWCRYNLQEFAAALEALVQLRERLAAPTTEPERALLREAGRDLPLFYVQIGRPEAARPFFQRVLDPTELVPALQRLGEQYWMMGRENDAALIRSELCRLQPERCAPGR